MRKLSQKELDIISIIALFLTMVIGVVIYTNTVKEINNGKITIISDSEMDK